MDFLTVKINNKIKKDSLEYKSMMDKKKSDNFFYLSKYFLSFIPQENRLSFDYHPSPRIFSIPVALPSIHHRKYATIGFDGGIFFHGKYFQDILDKHIFEERFSRVDNISIFRMRSIKDLRECIKIFFYRYLSICSYKKRRIFKNPQIVKIMFFGTAYENMYHFIFQYYPNIEPLVKYCIQRNLDFRIIMPAKCNRKKIIKACYNGYINELMQLENIPYEKMIFLDYQNYDVCNLIHTNQPIDHPMIVLSTMKKIQQSFYNSSLSYTHPRIYISRKKATHRFLINEDEIREILEKEYNFITLYMEDYSLSQKVNIMAHVNVIVSIDGTSLINGFFSQEKKVKLIGIRSYNFSEYNAITSSIFSNIEYLPIVAKTIDVERTSGPAWLKSNLYLEPKYFKETLEKYLS